MITTMTMLAVTVMIGSIALSGVSTAHAQLELAEELTAQVGCVEGSYPGIVGHSSVEVHPGTFIKVPIMGCIPFAIPDEIDDDVVPGPN